MDLAKVGYTANTAPQAIEQLRQRFSLLAGVEVVGVTDTTPFSFEISKMAISRLDGYAAPNNTPIMFDYAFVGPETFRALGIPVSQGGEIASADFPDHRRVALVNESFVKQYWPGQVALGKQINQHEIIGVVADARLSSPVEPPSPAVYFVADPNTTQYFTFIIRSKNNPESLLSAIRAELVKVHPRLGESRIVTMRQAMLHVLILERSVLKVIGALAAVGFVLTTLGVYGVTSYLVAQRRREIGIRLAIGARRFQVAKLIFRFGLGLAVAGVGFGLPAAGAAGWLLHHLLSGVTPLDLTSYIIASVVLLLAVSLACWFPATRAAKIDPMTTLRLE